MNLNNLMQQAQKMQRDITKKQDELNKMEFIGNSEWVEITLYGNKSVKSIKIKNKTSMDEEDLECLEDMIKLALTDAYKKIENETEKKMGAYSKMAGGLF